MVELGSGDYLYETSGEDWGNLPDDWTYKEATAVAVDEKDNVYVFNRGTHPMVVLNSEGDVIDTWGDGQFSNPHGVTIGPDGNVYCVDNADHTVRKYTAGGELLMELQAGRPAPAMSGDPFSTPAHLAVDARNGNMYVADGYSNARVHKYDPDGRLLQIDPAQFEGVQGPLSAVLLPGVQLELRAERRLEQGSAVDLVADELLDPMERGWQVVEIPLEAFGLKEGPIGSIRFLGRLEGEFLLDDLRLVSHVQRPGDTAVLEERGNAPAQFTLGKSYPNPFNGQVVIPFALAQDDEVELAVYDVLGQRVAVLVEGWRTAGPHEARWNIRAHESLASGVYFYRLQTDGGFKVGKLILLQ